MIDTSFIENSKGNLAIMIRHSERNNIPDGVHDIITPINEQGAIIATQLGEKLKRFESIKIISSPVNRCVQTGNAILSGYGKCDVINYSNLLGEPGPFVFDCKAAEKVFIDLTCKTVVEKQIAGETLTGIRPLKEGCELLKNWIISEIRQNTADNLLIFITHDAVLAPFIFKYTGEKFNHEHWIDYIDGVTFSEENGKFYIIRGDAKYELR